MNRGKIFFMALLLGLVALGASTPVNAADDMQQAYNDYVNTIGPLRQQLQEKRFELANLYQSGQRDDAKVKQVFEEIADLQSKLFVAESDFEAKAEANGAGYGQGYGMGMHHGGMMGYGGGMGRGGYMGGGMGMGHRGGMGMGMGMGHHGGGCGW